MFSYAFDEYLSAHLRDREREAQALQQGMQARLAREPRWRDALIQLRAAIHYYSRWLAAIAGHVPHRRAS